MRLALYFFCRATRTSFYVWEHDDEWSRSFGLKLKYCFYGSKGAQKGGGGITPYNGLYGEAPPERDVLSDFKYVTKKRFEKMHSPISLFFKNTKILFVVPPKFCKSIAFNFFWSDFSQEKLKTKLILNFWRTIKSIRVFFLKGVFLTCTSPKMHLVWPPKFCLSIVFNFSWDGCNTQENKKQSLCNYLFYFFFFRGEGVKTRCIMGDVQMANSILRASFLFIYLAFIQLFIYLFIYLLTGYWAMYVLQKSTQLTYQLEHVVTLVR